MQLSGTATPGFETITDAFGRTFDGYPDMGAALAIMVDGVTVVDLWGGYADARVERAWRDDTLSVIFSCTKGLLAITAARLVADRRLEYDAPVSRYWPEFAQAGKGAVTVRELLSHRAGLNAPVRDITRDEVVDWELMTDVLAEQAPLFTPGEHHMYHALTFGWLVGEVIARVTGQSVGAAFQTLVAAPLAAEAYIGLPPQLEPRVARLKVGASLDQWAQDQATDWADEPINWPQRGMTLGGALPVSLARDGGFNDPRLHAAEVPGAGGIATARALAAIWSSTVVATPTTTPLPTEVLNDALIVRTQGAPFFNEPAPYARWGSGFMLPSEARSFLSDASFGHDGAGGQVAFADREHHVGFAYITNQMEAGDTRAADVIEALRNVFLAR